MKQPQGFSTCIFLTPEQPRLGARASIIHKKAQAEIEQVHKSACFSRSDTTNHHHHMSDRAALKKELDDIDREMMKLSLKRVDVVNKMHHLATVTAMREVGEFSLKRLELELKGEMDPLEARKFISTSMTAWRHSLGHAFYPNAMQAIPLHGPSVLFSKQDAITLFISIADALKKDLAALK